MTYRVEYSKKAIKALEKTDKQTAKLILNWIGKNPEGCSDPRRFGKALTANHSCKWRYRIGNYRVISEIQDDRVIILDLEIGHRRDIYEK